jgi:hypothetical protein
MTFKYLEANITSNGNLKEEVQTKSKQPCLATTRYNLEKQVHESKEQDKDI